MTRRTLAILVAMLASLVLNSGVVSADELPALVDSAPATTVAPAAPPEIIVQYVEDPTRMAGGEDDTQRSIDRGVDQRDNDEGDKRRK